jgi:AcrR family transcriptional regulator/TfoX/Sxy family transcriptional regulator of competence genes
MTAAPAPRRRQARGQRRVDQLLDVAAQVFAEVGFEAATTNAIAARARVSPGSLYQFFPNKDALAEALAERFVQRLQKTQAIFGPELADMPLDALIDHIFDPLVAFHVAHPGFEALFSGSIVSPRLSAAVQGFLDAVVARAEALLEVRAPHLSPERRARCARVSVELVRALLPLVVASDPVQRDAMVVELKAAQRGYLAPLFGVALPPRDGAAPALDNAVMEIPRATPAARALFDTLVPSDTPVEVKPMFGNIGAFVNGNMFMGVFGSDVGLKLTDADQKALRAAGGQAYGPAERPMGGYVSLPAAFNAETARPWVKKSVDYVGGLPPKAKKPSKKRS